MESVVSLRRAMLCLLGLLAIKVCEYLIVQPRLEQLAEQHSLPIKVNRTLTISHLTPSSHSHRSSQSHTSHPYTSYFMYDPLILIPYTTMFDLRLPKCQIPGATPAGRWV